ncbi:MAG: hypothetical protein GY771_10200 [bacterium]|nr:hypothetical protein [bacterium]
MRKSFDSASRAVELYPSLARLRVTLARIAEQGDMTDVALANYRKAVEIEDAFRKQFSIMYPDHEVFSRLGQEDYSFAKKRIEQLSDNTTKKF